MKVRKYRRYDRKSIFNKESPESLVPRPMPMRWRRVSAVFIPNRRMERRNRSCSEVDGYVFGRCYLMTLPDGNFAPKAFYFCIAFHISPRWGGCEWEMDSVNCIDRVNIRIRKRTPPVWIHQGDRRPTVGANVSFRRAAGEISRRFVSINGRTFENA